MSIHSTPGISFGNMSSEGKKITKYNLLHNLNYANIFTIDKSLEIDLCLSRAEWQREGNYYKWLWVVWGSGQ